MLIEPKSKVVMIGDSITDCGRIYPIGDSSFENGLGNGYVSFVHALLASTYPEREIQILNLGISGNTVRDLKARWQSDVLDLRPDWLSIMIGINDVWRQFRAPRHGAPPIPLEEYEQTLEELIESVRPQLKGLVLMTPFFIEPHRSDPMRAMMDRYGQRVHHLAERYGAHLVDTQAAFDEVLRVLHPMQLAADRVHPDPAGHMILARAFLDALQYQWKR